MANALEHWRIDGSIDFEVGKSYVVDLIHDKGFWAQALITIQTTDGEGYHFKLDTLLTGSPGLVEGFLNG